MNISHDQFETMKNLCGIINSMPGKTANFKMIGDLKRQQPIVNIVESEREQTVISDCDTSFVIKSLCNFITRRIPNASI